MSVDFWTDRRVAQLTLLWEAGELTASAIALEMGVSKNAVLGKVHRLDLSARVVRAEKPKTSAEAVMALRADQCRYPFGDVGAEGFHFCEERQFQNSSYCEEHHVLCHVESALFDKLSRAWSAQRKLQHRARMLRMWAGRRAA